MTSHRRMFVQLVVEPDAAGAGDDDVGLLLLAVAVTSIARAGRVPEVTHAEVARPEVLAAEAPFHAGDATVDGVVDLEQVHDGVVGHVRVSFVS
jgi:hypothetical protein